MAAPITIRSSRSHSHKHSLSLAGAAFAPWMCSSSSQHPSNGSVGFHSWSKHSELMAVSPTDMEFGSRNISSSMGTSIDDTSLVDVQKQHCTGYSCCNRQLPDMHALMDHCDQEHPYSPPKVGLKSSLLPLPLNIHIRPRTFPSSTEGIPRLSPSTSVTDDDANFEIDMDEPPTPPPSGSSRTNHAVYIVSPDADIDISYGHTRLSCYSSETSLLRNAALTGISTNAVKSHPTPFQPFLQTKPSQASDIYSPSHLQVQAVPLPAVNLTHPSTFHQLSHPLSHVSNQVHYLPSSASALVHLHQTLQARPLAPSPSIDTTASAVASTSDAESFSSNIGRNATLQPHTFQRNPSTPTSNVSASGPIVPPTLLSTGISSRVEPSAMVFQRPALPIARASFTDMEEEDEDAEGEDEELEEYNSASRAEELMLTKPGFASSRSSPKRKASSKKGGSRNQRDTKRPRLSCPKPGCTKLYMNPNGLKYHLEKGTCTMA